MIRVTINLKLMPAMLALLGLNSYSWIIVPLTWFSCWVQFAFSTTVTLYRAYLVWYSNFLFFSSFWTHCSLNSERHKIFWILLKKSWSAIFPKILMWGWRQEVTLTPSHVLMANRREFSPRGQVFPCHLLIIFSTQISCFTQFFIHKNCFELFLSAHFLFWEILNLNLTFAVCRIYVTLKLSIVVKGPFDIPATWRVDFTFITKELV